METAQILDELANYDGMPVEAIRAARDARDGILPTFLGLVADRLDGQASDRDERTPHFFIFHLLGEWREKSAYRPLARLLRAPSDQVEHLLGDAITVTSHRVMAAVFDGDPQPLYDVILDPEADEFVRARMCDALATLVVSQELSREEAARFLRACFAKLEPEPGCFVWDGWQSAIALLGLEELKPLVEEAFRRDLIDPGWLELKDFEDDLAYALGHPEAPNRHWASEFRPFGDTVHELSHWVFARLKDEVQHDEPDLAKFLPFGSNEPVTDPLRNVGRNDPCPCGSGKKYKKCCLN
jgi:hypothetical protein